MDAIIPIGKQLRQKSKEGLTRMYDKHGGTIYGLLCQVVRDKETANVILLQTFKYAWKHSHTAPINDNGLFFWLLKIVRLFIKGKAEYKSSCSQPNKTPFLSHQQQSLLHWFLFQYCSKNEIAAKLNIPVDCLRTELRIILSYRGEEFYPIEKR